MNFVIPEFFWIWPGLKIYIAGDLNEYPV